MNLDHLHDIINAWDSPPMRHAMMGHLPIVLALLGLPVALWSAFLPKNITARWLAIAAYALLALAAWLTLDSGEQAQAAIDRALPAEVHELIEEHEDMANKVWLLALGALALLALSAIPKPMIRGIAAAGAALLGAVTIAWVSVTAHLGGTLVYTHGVGTGSATVVGEATVDRKGDKPDAALREAASGAAREPSEGESGPDDAKLAFFRAEIAPLLTSRCLNCHNPSRARRSGRLDQTTREVLMAGGRSGPAIVPGDPEASLLIQRVRGDDLEQDPMPPPPRDPLTPEQIAALERWIRDGAVWDATAITRPPPPAPPGPPPQP